MTTKGMFVAGGLVAAAALLTYTLVSTSPAPKSQDAAPGQKRAAPRAPANPAAADLGSWIGNVVSQGAQDVLGNVFKAADDWLFDIFGGA